MGNRSRNPAQQGNLPFTQGVLTIMGRRNASASNNPSSNNPENTDQNEENNTVTTEVIEQDSDTVAEATATDSTDTSTVTEATEAPAEDAIDPNIALLETFSTTVQAAVEARDTSTGVVPEANISEVNAAYRELDGVKAKTAAKKIVGEGMKTALNAMDLTTARAYMNLQEKLSAQGGSSKTATEKVPTDPTEALAQQFAVLSLAHSSVQVPDTIDPAKLNELIEKLLDGAQEKVTSYITYLSTETPEGEDEPAEPEVEGYIKNAAKLALGRSAKAGAAKTKTGTTGNTSSYAGPRRDVAKHIQSAFADKAVGTFMTIAQIAEAKSDEYTDSAGVFDKPSQGAISARLFPSSEGKKCTVVGVEPTTHDGKKGAKKV